jgi:hypothetical protein
VARDAKRCGAARYSVKEDESGASKIAVSPRGTPAAPRSACRAKAKREEMVTTSHGGERETTNGGADGECAPTEPDRAALAPARPATPPGASKVRIRAVDSDGLVREIVAVRDDGS